MESYLEILLSGKARRSSAFGRMPLITKGRDYAVERKKALSFLGFKECKEPLIVDGLMILDMLKKHKQINILII